LKEIRSKREAILSFLLSFVFDPIRPQSSTSRVGLLDLDRTEFETLKALFLEEAKSWLSDPTVVEMRLSSSVEESEDSQQANGGNISELETSSPTEQSDASRLILERARSQAHRALADCRRQKDKVSGALSKILSSDRVLKKGNELNLSAEDEHFPSEILRRDYQNLVKAEALCTQMANQSLGNCVTSIKRFPTVSKLNLPCVEWSDRLSEALKQVSQGEWIVDKSSANINHPPPLDITREELQNLEAFKAVAQSIVDSSSSFASFKATDGRSLALVQRLERVQKRITDVISIADAVLMIVNDTKDDCATALAAFKKLKKCFGKVKSVASRPLKEKACSRAPDFRDFLGLCSQMKGSRTDLSALSCYQDILISSNGIRPVNLAQACDYLEKAIPMIQHLEWVAPDHSDKAEYQAKHANARVRVRLNDEVEPGKLMSTLIEQATNEKNLSEMWIGWMAFL